MINNKKQILGKNNYDTNLSLNQEIDSSINETYIIFKEKFLQTLDNFFMTNIREKLNQRQNLIINLRENILNYGENVDQEIQPAYVISDNSIELIKNLNSDFSKFKVYSDKIKNELNFKNYETRFKLLFHNIFNTIDEIDDVINFYMKVFHNFNLKEQRCFYENISMLFSDLEKDIMFISE